MATLAVDALGAWLLLGAPESEECSLDEAAGAEAEVAALTSGR